MSNRENRIRGPQSALTDFLAANNISAGQIRDDYLRRVREAQQEESEAGPSNATPRTRSHAVQNGDGDGDDDYHEDSDAHDSEEAAAAADLAVEASRKRKKTNQAALAKTKATKVGKKKAARMKAFIDKYGWDTEDEEASDPEARMAAKEEAFEAAKKKLPGQLANCELCEKRFTVTPYTKNGPSGGLLCTPCGKKMAADEKAASKDKKKKAAPAPRQNRRKGESNRLDGMNPLGPKSLKDLCIEKLGQCADDVEELGYLPDNIMARVAQIFSKNRKLKPSTLPLFVRSDLDKVFVHDAAYLDTEHFNQIFAVMPKLRVLVLQNAGQFKDANMLYMIDKAHNLEHLQLYSANLVTEPVWRKMLTEIGPQLETIKLTWLDAAFDDSTVEIMTKHCSRLKRLKLKYCRKVGTKSFESISEMVGLEHLSLRSSEVDVHIAPETLVNMVMSLGHYLQTLSLEHFEDADDNVLSAIHEKCRNLRKLRFSDNAVASDAAFARLFTNWENKSLSFVDFQSTRSVDNANPDGPDEPLGLGTAGFTAMMAHSRETIEVVKVSSCRHISAEAFMEVFREETTYPMLREMDLSFCATVDGLILQNIFRSCPNLKKCIVFGCFNLEHVIVPQGVNLTGVPRAQENIEQYGTAMTNGEAHSFLDAMELDGNLM